MNSFANALTISTNLGSALWTASATNLAKLTNVSLGMTLFIYGIAVVIFNVFLLGKPDWSKMIGNLIFIVPFSFLVQMMLIGLNQLNVEQMPLIWRLILDVIGIALIAVAISIYQRVNLVLHPNDDLTYILRFKYLHGNPVKAQLISFIPPLIILIICGFMLHTLIAVNIGTLVALLFQGSLIGCADHHVFTKLQYNIRMK